jgi:hypothetical protein
MPNSPFVKKGDKCDIKFYLKVDNDGLVILSPEDLSKLPSMTKDEYDECNVTVNPLNWGTVCNLQSNSHVFDQESGKKVFDGDRYVQLKLRALVISWDFTYKDQDGEDVPVEVSEDSVDALHSLVGDYVLKEYNRRYEMTDDDRKNF